MTDIKLLNNETLEEKIKEVRIEFNNKYDETTEALESKIKECKKELFIREKRKSKKAQMERDQIYEQLERLEDMLQKTFRKKGIEWLEICETNIYVVEHLRRIQVVVMKRREIEEQEKQQAEEERERQYHNRIISELGGYGSLLNELQSERRKHEGRAKRTSSGNLWKVESRIKSVNRQLERVQELQKKFSVTS